ncbi:MAG: molybdate ABC transporter substrate-binding protein [Pseudomonadota bacterium]
MAVGLACLLAEIGRAAPAHAQEQPPLRVAVAANFVATADAIARRLQIETGMRVLLTSGATGHLFAQIAQGAPFDVFLAADEARPALAISQALATPNSQKTYALGQLVLFVPSSSAVREPRDLVRASVQRIAIANPRTAPYGAAAEAVFRHFGIHEPVAPKLVRGQNVLHALQFVVTGNADAGFVARSLVMDRPARQVLSIPRDAYAPIRQDAVIVATTRQPARARAFLDYLSSSAARDIIASAGYLLPDEAH